jgi:hypothetical protein
MPIAAHGSLMGTSEERISPSRADRRLWTSFCAPPIFSGKLVTRAEGLHRTYEESVRLVPGAGALYEKGQDTEAPAIKSRGPDATQALESGIQSGKTLMKPKPWDWNCHLPGYDGVG